MMNVICLVGRLVHTPDLKSISNGNFVTTFTVAVERNRTGQDGQKQTDYIDIVAWHETAKFVCKYFQKGSWIGVNGSLRTRTYEDRNGNKRKAFEVLAENVNFVGAKAAAGAASSYTPEFTDLSEEDDGIPF